MNVDKVIEELIRAVDEVHGTPAIPPGEAKHLSLRVKFEHILKRSAGGDRAVAITPYLEKGGLPALWAKILEAILRTIDPGMSDEMIREWLREGDWTIHASKYNESSHGRFAAVYTTSDEMTLEAWLYETKKDALKKYIDLAEGHDDESSEYLMDLGEYPGDPTSSTKIIPVKATYAIEE